MLDEAEQFDHPASRIIPSSCILRFNVAFLSSHWITTEQNYAI
jgi:hypothetical protein